MNVLERKTRLSNFGGGARRRLLAAMPGALAGLALLALGAINRAGAEVRLPKVFGSHMVLQQGRPLTFWGWGQPNETVTVKMLDETKQAQANDKGEWKAILPATKAGGPLTVTVSGSSTVTFEDVMVGEVWLCSGQSNMEMGIRSCQDGEAEIAAANYPGIRLLMVANRWTPTPQTDIEDAWKVCSPKTIGENGWGGFSAAAYYFGRELHQKLGVAVGLIDATWGGTRIESWTPPEGFAGIPALKKEEELVKLGDPRTPVHQEKLSAVIKTTEEWVASAKKALNDKAIVPSMPTYPPELLPPHDVQQSTALYNGMIHPLCPFAHRGAIWYQGESNNGEGMLYAERMKALIEGWRKVWCDDTLSFYFVQIAPYNYGGKPEPTAELWEAQTAAQAIPHTGMVVVNDIGNVKDIHPANKQDVGKRLARWALAKDYGRENVVFSGPAFKSMAIDGDKIRLTFDYANGLASRDGKPLTWFEVIDADEGGFASAEARIDGSSIVLSAPGVKHPVAMRYAWHMLAEPNLMNNAGLPAGAFRAGTVPKRDLLTMNVPEAKDYQLVYDLDLAKLGRTIAYTEDNRKKIGKEFDRVAYFMELQNASGESQFVYVSMDAFTTDLGKIGVPAVGSDARFQQNVANMNVYSNVKGIVAGKGLAGGNIEFWPSNYGQANSAGVPNASGETYDFGDQPDGAADGYGCMQVHNHDSRQTLFALNHWIEGEKADIGIGNNPEKQPDWTFTANAKSYQAKRLRVFVHCK
jgi:sialate O-acetylesterase